MKRQNLNITLIEIMVSDMKSNKKVTHICMKLKFFEDIGNTK